MKLNFLFKLLFLIFTIQIIAINVRANDKLKTQDPDAFMKENASKPGVTWLNDNYSQYRVVRPGNGINPDEKSIVSFCFKATLPTGKELLNKDKKPVEVLDIPMVGLIHEVRQALWKIKEGGQVTLFLRPKTEEFYQQYGQNGQSPVVILEIELLKVLRNERNDFISEYEYRNGRGSDGIILESTPLNLEPGKVTYLRLFRSDIVKKELKRSNFWAEECKATEARFLVGEKYFKCDKFPFWTLERTSPLDRSNPPELIVIEKNRDVFSFVIGGTEPTSVKCQAENKKIACKTLSSIVSIFPKDKIIEFSNLNIRDTPAEKIIKHFYIWQDVYALSLFHWNKDKYILVYDDPNKSEGSMGGTTLYYVSNRTVKELISASGGGDEGHGSFFKIWLQNDNENFYIAKSSYDFSPYSCDDGERRLLKLNGDGNVTQVPDFLDLKLEGKTVYPEGDDLAGEEQLGCATSDAFLDTQPFECKPDKIFSKIKAGAKVYEEKSTSSKLILSLTPKDKLCILKSEENWLRIIKSNGVSGWVLSGKK